MVTLGPTHTGHTTHDDRKKEKTPYLYIESVSKSGRAWSKGLYQYCACKWFGTYTLCKCKCKNKNIYIILRGLIKQCKYKNMYIYIILYDYVK